ncbi:DUF4352 domain-containing protein [Mycobacterium sp. B14F4]|uniref:DUF4352 domain-containing protein n=1 Tax=Mycobacterium sp. B14F4 TaxID=3153565 RepID=UPI00325CE8CC
MTSPAGWYPDPDGSGGQRYFNGEAWTEHRQAPAGPVELGVTTPPPRSAGPDPKVIAGLVAAAVVLVAVLGVSVFLTLRTGGTESAVTRVPADAGETSAPLGETAAAVDEHTPTVGQEVRDGDFAFVISGVERVDAVADPAAPELQKAAAGEYIIVKMTVTNVGTEPQTFFASFNTLSDGTTTYESDDEAWIYLGNTLADLNPGDSIDTAVVFDVPDGTQPVSVELHDGPYSDGVTVELE